MQITWYGQTCFQIISQRAKDEPVKIVIDPLEQGLGLRVPKLEPDILLLTSKSYSYSDIKGKPFLINGPGEYETKGIFLQGILCNGDITIYTIEAEGVRICHLGANSQNDLDNGVLEKIGNIDILMLPVGGGIGLKPQEASKVISQIDPRLIIPMLYQVPKLKQKLEQVDKFLKTMGKKTIEPLAKLSIKKKDLAKEGTEIIVLRP